MRGLKMLRGFFSTFLCIGLLLGNMQFDLRICASNSFKTDAYVNHWGRSDVRDYLNNRHSGYASFFNENEYEMIQETVVQTNVWGTGTDEISSIYETKDKFFLPSGNYYLNRNAVISWGAEDISENSLQDKVLEYYSEYLIPKKYFTNFGWLRSPCGKSPICSLYTRSSGKVKKQRVNLSEAVAPVFKISLSSISFASIASATNLKNKKGIIYDVPVDDASLIDYGMYLKRNNTQDNFTINNLSYDDNQRNLTVSYTGGVIGEYIVVCTESNNSAYCAAGKINEVDGAAVIDCSDWRFDSLNNLKLKLWMESDSKDNVTATNPFICDGSKLDTVIAIDKEDIGYTENFKAFALKKDLGCSWGEVMDISGNYNGGTNQKIYFGTKNNKPIQFWIAGREDQNGNLNYMGEVMCLYQAEDLDAQVFNADIDSYVGEDSVTLILKEDISESYTGFVLEYPESSIVVENENKCNVRWRYRELGTENWIYSFPIDIGEYELQAYLPENDAHELIYSVPVNFEVISLEEWEWE